MYPSEHLPSVWPRRGTIILCTLLAAFALAVIGITGYFRLSSEASDLRRTVMHSAGGRWDKKIAVRVGYFTTGLVRFGSQFVHMPPEAQAALASMRGGEVGIYKWQKESSAFNPGDVLASADKSMTARGWTRIVGVLQNDHLVGVYMPAKSGSGNNLRCCVMVLEHEQLVIASARGNVTPLVRLATERIKLDELGRTFALR